MENELLLCDPVLTHMVGSNNMKITGHTRIIQILSPYEEQQHTAGTIERTVPLELRIHLMLMYIF